MKKITKKIIESKKKTGCRPKAVQHIEYLTLLKKSANNKKKRQALLDYADKDELSAVTECVQNILAGNVPLSKEQLKKLRRHKRRMRELSQDNISIVKHKRVLNQSGGFLQAILPLALGALGPIIGGLFGGR